MTAYIIALRHKVTDPAEMATYTQMARAIVTPGKRNLAAYGRCEALEGPPVEGAVLLEFPTYEAAKAWYDGPEYTAAREHRFKGADYQFVLFEGM